MSNGWTEERRRRQSLAIRRWQPWERSTGPRTADGKTRSSRNAYRGGTRPQFRALVKALNEAMREVSSITTAPCPPGLAVARTDPMEAVDPMKRRCRAFNRQRPLLERGPVAGGC